jgi:hypothetical protein
MTSRVSGLEAGIEGESLLQEASLRRRRRQRASALVMRVSRRAGDDRGAVEVSVGTGNSDRVALGPAVVTMLRG